MVVPSSSSVKTNVDNLVRENNLILKIRTVHAYKNDWNLLQLFDPFFETTQDFSFRLLFDPEMSEEEMKKMN